MNGTELLDTTRLGLEVKYWMLRVSKALITDGAQSNAKRRNLGALLRKIMQIMQTAQSKHCDSGMPNADGSLAMIAHPCVAQRLLEFKCDFCVTARNWP